MVSGTVLCLPPFFPVLNPLFLTGGDWSVEVRTPTQACQSERHFCKLCYTLEGVLPMERIAAETGNPIFSSM